MDKRTILLSLVISCVTGALGMFLFYGSVHSGGLTLFLGIVFMPFLYFDYKGIILIESIMMVIFIGFVVNFILWLAILMSIKKVQGNESTKSESKAI